MNKKTIIKASALGAIGIIATFAMFVAGSYDPYNEMAVLTVDRASAELEIPSLDVPTLETPSLDTPELDTPELDLPGLDIPELDIPSLDIPDLDIPDLDIPDLDIPDLDIPDLDIPDTSAKDCSDFGYNYQVAKFEPFGSHFTGSAFKYGYYVNVDGNTHEIDWTSDPSIDAVIAKAATDYEEFSGGTSGNIKKGDIGTGKHEISHVLFCAEKKVEVEKECEMEITKEVDKTTAKAGDVLTYTITVENVGECDCTGGGVRIYDELDAGLTFVDSTYTSNLSGGYGSDPLYNESTRMLRWNGHTLTPGETGEIIVEAKVTEATTCGDYEIKNQAKVTAKELNNFSEYFYSDTVKTDVDNECPADINIIADKVVCTEESDLPNWGNGGADITNTTAADWVATHSSCSLVSGWEFQWGPQSAYDPGDTFVGEANAPWLTFGDTDGNGRTSTKVTPDSSIGDKIWVREVLKNGYIPFTHEANGKTNVDDVTAEMYCHTDVKNYDNYDFIANPVAGETYHCVAFNSQVKVDTPDPVCKSFDASPDYFDNGTGGTVTLTWDTENADSVSIDNGIGDVADDGNTDVNVSDDTTFTLTATGNGKTITCPASVVVDDPVPEQPVCPLVAKDGRTIIDFDKRLRSDKDNEYQTDTKALSLASGKYDITLVSWDGYIGRENTSQPNEAWKLQFMQDSSVLVMSNAISDLEDNVREATKIEQVNDSFELPTGITGLRGYHAVYKDTSSPNSVVPICAAIDEIPEDPIASCDSFVGNPTSIKKGESATLTWETTNAESVSIDNGIGDVADDGVETVSPVVDTTYKMTVYGLSGQQDTCEATIKVTEEENKVPECVSFDATPTTFDYNGGTSTLTWDTTLATEVSIDNGVGSVALDGSTDVFVDSNITYTLTAKDADGDEDQCTVSMTLEEEPEPLTCAADVDFTISDTKVDKGDSITLDWDVNSRVTDVSIDQGIGDVANTGNKTFSVDDDTTYTLTAKLGDETVKCPVSVDMDGGGGGGSSSPRCELEISDRKIKLGEEITISWDTTRATEVTLIDDEGEVLFTTDDYLSKDKEDYFDGSIDVEPTRDTEYTLIAERGSKDKECSVDVEVEGNEIVIIEERTHTPLVAGISLTSVPYTGFEAGPLLTMLFYLVLMTWALYIAYVIVVKKNMFVTAGTPVESITLAQSQQTISPQSFVKAVTPPAPTVVKNTAPVNLPTEEAAPVAGYAQTVATPTYATEEAVKAIEDKAHASGTLLSSDAVRVFMTMTQSSDDADTVLDSVLATAKVKFPMEDGWVVLNHDKMTALCAECMKNTPAVYPKVSVPTGSGSLAESIVSGDIAAAYALIGHRPMVSLADASADLDALYRTRKGENNEVSDLLKSASTTLTDEQIKDAIVALTSALDGTYDEEGEAVKMAIMKAVKATS